VRLINEKPPEELAESITPYLDLRELTRFIAVQNFLGELDGFNGKWGMNNFYLYRLQHHQQHVVIAWDDDLTFADPGYELTSYQDNNVLVRKLMAIPEYHALYFDTLTEAMQSAAQLEGGFTLGALETEIRRELDLTNDAMLADRVRPTTDDDYLAAREFMTLFAQRRIRYVECGMARRAGHPCD
jgi:spore coat protein CotH